MTKLNIGCGKDIRYGWVNLDGGWNPDADYVYDLESGEQTGFKENTFDEMAMSHVMEHISKPLPMMQELWRIAKHGCRMVVDFPYGSSDDAFEDPTHVRYYFPSSFLYFGQPAYHRADYGYRGDWILEEVILWINPNHPLAASPDEAIKRIDFERNVVQSGRAFLRANKPARPPKLELMERYRLSVSVAA